MITLNLEAKTKEQELIKAYLQENASEILAEKINVGTPFEKDGKRLLNRKTLDGFMSYACDEARKQAGKNARGACVEDKTVFGWAIHYFEEDSIEGTLFNEDGTEYKPPKPKYEPKAAAKPAKPAKPQLKQQTLFDLMNPKKEEATEEPETAETEQIETPAVIEPIETKEPDENDQPTDEEINEILKELAEEEAKDNVAFEEVSPKEEPKGSPMYQRYEKLQQTYPDSIIAMRLGDFYEVYGEKAVMLSDELNLTLTGRDCGLTERVPMVGFPYRAADMYIRKISEKHEIAVVETLGDVKVISANEPDLTNAVDPETGEILTEAEMREFDGDIEEPKDVPANDELAYEQKIAQSFDSATGRKLSDLFGEILIVR